MASRTEREVARLRDRLENGDPAWPAQLAVGLTILSNLALTDRVSVGPTWLVPAIESVLLVALIVVQPSRLTTRDAARHRFTLIVIAIVSATNIASLVLLIHYLINGGKAGGHALIGSGAVIWVNLVLLFAVWFWELDRGGPVSRHLNAKTMPDFFFPQMDPDVIAQRYVMPDWRPGFLDYLYLSLTNASAFSPTDTMPLTEGAKALMGLEATTALLTVGLVIARAVNILA
jgi:hypothetical protein